LKFEISDEILRCAQDDKGALRFVQNDEWPSSLIFAFLGGKNPEDSRIKTAATAKHKYVQADFCIDLKKITQGICKFAQAGRKMGVKSGLFQSFSRLFHRKIGKIPVFLWFFGIFRSECLRVF